jgi:hypothetical protein
MVVAVAARQSFVEALSQTFRSSDSLAGLPEWTSQSPAYLDSWIGSFDALDALIVESKAEAAATHAPGPVHHEELAQLKLSALLVGAAAKRMANRKCGCIACVVWDRQYRDMPNTPLCEAAAGFVRSSARDLERYGVTVNGLMVGSEAPGVNAANSKVTALASQLVYALTLEETKHLTGQVFMMTGTSLGLVASPSVESRLVSPGRRFEVPELAALIPAVLQTQGSSVNKDPWRR